MMRQQNIHCDRKILHLYITGYKMNVLKQGWCPIFWLNIKKSFLASTATFYFLGIFLFLLIYLLLLTGKADLP